MPCSHTAVFLHDSGEFEVVRVAAVQWLAFKRHFGVGKESQLQHSTGHMMSPTRRVTSPPLFPEYVPSGLEAAPRYGRRWRTCIRRLQGLPHAADI